ncbi:hypothetical protein K474DRAFT_1703170 [Panus rudis PR-1116 ss-1]|nr:hypothetical protein K474DRAFT_1703170 [Panus rudis PR-1116 ss-1]
MRFKSSSPVHPRKQNSSSRFQTEEDTLIAPVQPSEASVDRQSDNSSSEDSEPLLRTTRMARPSVPRSRQRTDALRGIARILMGFVVLCTMFLAVYNRPSALWCRSRCFSNNLASTTQGAIVLSPLTSPTAVPVVTGRASQLEMWQGGERIECQGPHMVLHPQLKLGGCWTFNGAEAQLAILLSKPAFITNISIAHISRSAISSAPRDVTVWGVVDGLENTQRFARSSASIKKIRSEISSKLSPPTVPYPLIPLASLHYDIRYGTVIQSFQVIPEIAALGMDFGIIIFRIHSNWGSDHTDLYHVGVYGTFIQI